ncbi:hypothetical protein Ancab_019764, partial [Ancistrocladus abbreviatus]
DDNRGKEERKGTDELSGLDSDESISIGWVSEMGEGSRRKSGDGAYFDKGWHNGYRFGSGKFSKYYGHRR